MAYDPIYRGMSPNAQIASAIATPLSQVLGGYLGAKLEENKLRREVESNKSVLGAIFNDLPPEQLDKLSRVPSSQLNSVIEGLQSKQVKNIFNAGQGLQGTQSTPGIPSMAQLQQLPQMPQSLSQPIQQDFFSRGIPEPQGMQNIQSGQEMFSSDAIEQLPSLSDVPRGGYTQTQVVDAAGRSAAELDAMQEALNASNVSPEKRLQIEKVIIAGRANINNQLQNREKIRLQEIDAQVKMEQNDRDYALRKAAQRLKEDEYAATRSDKERDRLEKERDRLDAEQQELIKEFGPGYNKSINSEGAIRQEVDDFDLLDLINESKDSDFGYQLWTNVAGGWVVKKVGDMSAYLGTANEITNKISNNLVIAQINKLSGKGLGPVKANMVEIIKAGGPTMYQSPQARGLVIKLGRIAAKEELKKIQIQKKLYEENDGFVKNFNGIVENRMKPYYKKFSNQKKDVLRNLTNIAKAQTKRFQGKNIYKAGEEFVSNRFSDAFGYTSEKARDIYNKMSPVASRYAGTMWGGAYDIPGQENARQIASGVNSTLSAGGEYLANRPIPPLAQKLLFSE